MAEATKEAGLTTNGTEEEMWKLMESGKLLAKDVIPAFAKELRKTATDGNSLAHALEFNLRVALGRALIYVQDLSDALYTGGLATSLKLVVDSFNEIAPKVRDVAFLFGKVLGGAITGVTFPIVLLVAALTDLWTITKMITGVNDEMGASFLSLGAQIFGVIAGVRLLFWGLKKVGAMLGFIKAAKDIIEDSGQGGSKDGKGKSKTTKGRNRRFPKGTNTSPTSSKNPLSKVNVGNIGLGAVAAGTVTAASAWNVADNFGKFAANFWEDAFQNIAESFRGGNASITNNPVNSYLSPQKLDINVKTSVDESGNLQSFVDSRIESADTENQERAMNSIGALY